MIRLYLVWSIMLMFVSGYSQQITIKDDSTNEALEFVSISSFQPRILKVTDAKGQVDISAFKESQEIRFSIVGYKTLTLSYADIEKLNFTLLMKKSVVSLDQVVVSGYVNDASRKTSFNIVPLNIEEIDRQGSFSITDALARIPGVSQFSTGVGISKPVIRGLYGNRILVLFSGLRFDNQQWQDEHGLGLSDVGISRIELIKGPMSLLYGTETIGGVINVIEEGAPAVNTRETEVKLEGHTNNGGGTFQFGTKYNNGKYWYRLRVGADSYADYSDGNNNRVLNSRFNGYYLKSSIGFKRKNWKSVNHYNLAYNNFGFVFNDLQTLMTPDSRWSRSMSGPHHIVFLNTFSSVNDIKLKKSVLKLNGGFQSNYRAEDEGGGDWFCSFEVEFVGILAGGEKKG